MNSTLFHRAVRQRTAPAGETRARSRILKFVPIGFLLLGLAWVRLGPLPPGLLDARGAPSTVVVDRHGVVLYEARSEAGTRGAAISADALPPLLVEATMAAEDARFLSHPGLDPVALVRAAVRNVRAGRVAQGGSTITQQVAKLLLARRDAVRGGPDGAAPRLGARLLAKLREAVVALRLEHRLTKDQILALYLSVAPYGNQIVGAARASEVYFGCSVAMLTPAQAAWLAALPQRPSTFNPLRSPEGARQRQRVVLARMASRGAISEADLAHARAERVTFRGPAAPFAAPHFVEMVLGSHDAARPARIETTLDADLQADVAGILRSQRPALASHHARNVAVVVLENSTGEWLAWEGSGDYFDADHGGAINGPLVPRQPGSALKPLTYALAFESGYTPASVLPDVPAHFPTAEPGVVYSPRNYDGVYRGPLLARAALAGSENVPAVALAADLGVPSLVRFLRRARLSTLDKQASYYGLGITLGNAEVRLDELVVAYAAFARGGTWLPARAVRSSGSWRGDGEPGRGEPLVSPRTAFWVTDILADAEAREYIFGRGGALEFPFPVAVKTGTSQGYHDNWTIGYTRDVTVGVWVGNFDRTPLVGSSGVTGAGPVFHAVMLAAQQRVATQSGAGGDDSIRAVPGDVERTTICSLSGMPAGAACPTRRGEWMPAGVVAPPCSWHHASDDGLLVVWPEPFRAWAKRRGLLAEAGALASIAPARFASGPAPTHAPAASAAPPTLRIVSPPDGAIYLIDPTLRRQFQTLPLRASAAAPASPIEWFVDGRLVGAAGADDEVHWPLAPGAHRVEARDRAGRRSAADVLVK